MAEYLRMSDPASPGCSTLLIGRLLECPGDGAAWEQFVARYGGTIYGWCRRWRLQDADALEVTQAIFAALLHRLKQFDRSRGRFRNWLYRIAQNAVMDWCEQARRERRGTEGVRQLLASLPARSDLQARLGEEFDLELLEVAEASVRLKVSPKTWDAYVLCCKEAFRPREAARRIGIRAGHVSKYALRVRDMLAQEVAALERGSGKGSDEVREDHHDPLPLGKEMAAVPSGPAESA